MTSSGKSVFVSDGEAEPITLSMLPGAEFQRIWSADETAQLPTDGSEPSAEGYFPGEGWIPLWVLFSAAGRNEAARRSGPGGGDG